ncbi:MAG: thioredoxin [Patescibacteria group bacterium]
MSEVTFTDQNFEEEVIKSDKPVLVDFWAPWCGPCKMQGPIIEELAEVMKDKNIKIGKLNVDDNQATGQTYGIMSIPTLAIFKDGEVAETMVGLQSKEVLQEKLEYYAGA